MNTMFIEIIEATTPDPNLLMWKYHDQDREIKNGAQLTVRESQKVMFLNEGQVADIFEPGLHKLKTENIPILSRLKGFKYGFQSPFKADVYFFNTRNFVNNKWGTPAPILLNDPQFGQIRVRAFGSFDIRIADVPTFFRQYAGSFQQFTIFEVQHELRDFIAPKFGEVLANENMTVTDVAGNIAQLGKKIEPFIKPYLASFGLELTQFVVTSVTLPDEVTKHYDQVTNMNMVTDMDKFTKFSTAQAIGEKGTTLNEATTNAVAMGMMMKSMQQGAKGVDADRIVERDIVSKLKQLKQLFEADLIDEEEYKLKKSELVEKL